MTEGSEVDLKRVLDLTRKEKEEEEKKIWMLLTSARKKRETQILFFYCLSLKCPRHRDDFFVVKEERIRDRDS